MGGMALVIIGWIIIGGLAGWIASALMKARTGLLANIGLGIAGSVVLNFILGTVGIYAGRGLLPQLIVGAAGAALLIWLWRRINA